MRLRCWEHDITEEAWEEHLIGIWYGAATAEQTAKALELGTGDAIDFLSALPKQKALGWEQTAANLGTMRRFYGLTEQDWIFIYFGDSLHFAKVLPDVRSDVNHKWNFKGEVFKFRGIKDKKSFSLRDLPDGFRLLTMSGRSNVYQIRGAERLVRILADSADTARARDRILEMPWKEWLNLLGPSSWESIALGYLILEKGFVPTGLDIGRTLPTFDIVGRDCHGNRILAQCKKNPDPVPIDDEFLRLASESPQDAQYFYFTYGGSTSQNDRVQLLTRADIENWLETNSNGQKYLEWIRS